MQTFVAGQANTLKADLVARADCSPIISGPVTFYLTAESGTNAGKWWKASTSTWSATEVSAGAGTHKADGHWSCSIVAAAWISGVRYSLYAKESGDLHVPYSAAVVEGVTAEGGAIAFEYTMTDADTGLLLGDCRVWVTTDLAGSSVIRDGYTNSLGVVTFYLDAGTYHFWRFKDGYTFTNPDTEVVS